MVKQKAFFKVAVAVTAICSLLLTSCEKPVDYYVMVSVKSETVQSDAGSQFVSIRSNGSWTLSLQGEGVAEWASLSKTEGSSDTNSIILTFKENEGETSRKLIVIAESGTSESRCEVTQLAPAEDDGQEDKPESTIDLTKTLWLELPAMDNPDLSYYSHSFRMNGKSYRNYSFGWSQEDLVSHWVAYPLCKMYTNSSVNRTNAWAYDPLLGYDLSSAPFGGYGGSYARGHQLPSADRLDSEANAKTFYFTNMTPQNGSLNEGAWAELETKVRDWSKQFDTLYVVTGCSIEGSTQVAKDNDGKSVKVPVGYYKALLGYSKAGSVGLTGENGGYTGCAFWFDNAPYSGSFMNQAMTIAELEDMLGIDFFVNLPSVLDKEKAAKVEETEDSWWK